MKKFCQSNLLKNLKLVSLLCFLLLGLAGCNKGNQIPQIGGGNNTRPSSPADPAQPNTNNADRSDIAAQLTAPQINVSDNIGGGLSLFSVGSDLQLEGYQILYQVEIASDDAFSDIIYDEHVSVQEVDLSGTTYYTPDFSAVTWPSLTTGQTYHIRVRRVARKSGENDIVGAYSEAVEFTAPDLTCLTPVPQTTTLASSDQSHILNFLVHSDSANCGSAAALLINSHEIEVASDEEFSSIEETGTVSHQATLLNVSDLSRSFTLTNKLSAGTYYWRTRNRIVLDNGDVIVGPYSGGVELVVSQ